MLAKDKVADDGTITPGDTTPDVTFKNAYEPESINLSGTKTWDDYNGMFNLRPTVQEFWNGLTIQQVGNGVSLNLKTENMLQDTEQDKPYYYMLDETAGDNDYVIRINNLPKWAPDGTAYQYEVSEDLSQMKVGDDNHVADGYYSVVVGEATVNANSADPSFKLENALRGQVTVHKNWSPSDDPYGIRPTSVTVRLQARLVYDNGTKLPTDGSWKDARTLLIETGYATEEQLSAAGIDEAFVVRELNANNGWNASCNRPAHGRCQQDGRQRGRALQHRVPRGRDCHR